jgi:hypothetical protein
MQLAIARWRVEYDPDLTRHCFAQLPRGSGCDCSDCRNFDTALDVAFPAPFKALAHTLGVDLSKPAELTPWGREPSGLHLVGGWYHVVGAILEGADVVRRVGGSGTLEFEELLPGFEFGFGREASLVPEVFHDRRIVQLEFQARVPWVLSESEPE